MQTIFNRRRYIPELRDRNFNIRAFGERTAANSPIQGSAADLIKVAMIQIHKALAGAAARRKMLLQVHDELVFEVPRPELDDAQALVKHEMEHAAELSVPARRGPRRRRELARHEDGLGRPLRQRH